MLFAFAVMIENCLNLSLDPGENNHFSRQTQITSRDSFLFSGLFIDASTDLEQFIRDDFTISLRHVR